MKKLFAAVLAAALALSFSCTAFAATVDQDTDPPEADVTVSTEIAPTYTVTIPTDTKITFNGTSTPFGSIELAAAQIHPGKAVRVSVAAGTLENEADPSKTLPYKVMSGADAFTTATYQTAGEKTNLTIDIAPSDWNTAFAGKYSGTVIFTVAYVDAQ